MRRQTVIPRIAAQISPYKARNRRVGQDFLKSLGHVHTKRFSKTFVFILSKTHKGICVHARVLIAFSTFDIDTKPRKRIRNIHFCHQDRRRFYFLRKVNATFSSRLAIKLKSNKHKLVRNVEKFIFIFPHKH